MAFAPTVPLAGCPFGANAVRPYGSPGGLSFRGECCWPLRFPWRVVLSGRMLFAPTVPLAGCPFGANAVGPYGFPGGLSFRGECCSPLRFPWRVVLSGRMLFAPTGIPPSSKKYKRGNGRCNRPGKHRRRTCGSGILCIVLPFGLNTDG